MILQAIRSALFYLLFLGQTVVLAVILGGHAAIVRRRTAFGWAIAQYWGRANLFLLRWVTSIRAAGLGRKLSFSIISITRVRVFSLT